MVALGERTTPNGQELLAEFIQYGHQKPFEEIVRRYAGMVFNVCYRITKDKHEAEDATQAVFLTLALQAKRGADIKALGPWLQQVGKRLALDSRRSKKRRLNREERHHTEQTVRRESLLDDALPSADLDELKTILHEELQKLPAKYRMPLILHYFGGLTRDEMAAELNCKASTLGVRIFRGREMLAGRLSSRGIHISTAMLAVLLGYAVKRAVSESLIAATSHAATAMLAGHDGAGYASAHVIGLTRRAGNAMAIGKVKMAAITLMLAGTSLGAGAKALGIIPPIAAVKQMISNQLMRMVSPLVNPFSQPIFRVEAPSVSTPAQVAAVPVANQPVGLAKLYTQPGTPTTLGVPTLATNTGGSGIVIPVVTPSRSASTDSLASANHHSEKTSVTLPAPVDRSANPSATAADQTDPTVTASAAAVGDGAGGNSGTVYHLSDPLPSRATEQTTYRPSDLAFNTNNLYVGSPNGVTGLSTKTSKTSGSTDPIATPAALVQIPSTGSVTESSKGVLRGYGTIHDTGTLVMNGKVVADGGGVDRTLNFSSISAIQTASSGSSPIGAAALQPAIATTSAAISTPDVVLGTNVSTASSSVGYAFSNFSPALLDNTTNMTAAVTTVSSPAVCFNNVGTDAGNTRGWYAVNHGRFTFSPFASSSNPSQLTWGDDPNAASLSVVNSVRIQLNTTDTVPATLSLLATDRSDAPSLLQITGQPIGLWEVDPNGPALASADLSILYNSALADELGASPSSIELWTYGDATGDWQQVDPSSFALDSAGNIVSGSASDINFFAVSVQPTIGGNVNDLIASHLAQFSGGSTGGRTESVPEPIALPMIALGGAALLGRRRRRI